MSAARVNPNPLRRKADTALEAAAPGRPMARYCPWPERDWPGRDPDAAPLRAPLICPGTRATDPSAVLLRYWRRMKALQAADYYIPTFVKEPEEPGEEPRVVTALTRDDYQDAKRVVIAIALWWEAESRLHDGDNLFVPSGPSGLDNI